ncbi:MAG: hypothetical protein MJ185_02660 [Treponema sp.]|nr:hypothetical protein [Treponema sp.]
MKNKSSGVTALFILFTNLLFSCNFFKSIEETVINKEENKITITALSLSKMTLETKVGHMEYLQVSVKPATLQKEVKLNWTFDSEIIECDTSSSWGVIVKGLQEGQTTLRCSYDGYDASCLISVKGYSENYTAVTEPYIYSNYSILQTTPGVSEKVFVSLYGGDASDIDGYNWSVDNSSVAQINPTGQYCVFTAKEPGYARVKITHPKAAYPYYMGIYVFEDASKISYITTSNNIVTLNQADGDSKISVSLVNGKDTSRDSDFSWETIWEEGSHECATLHTNGNNAVITPNESGSFTIRVTHPDAVYPLDILCRVITIVKNVYINPSDSVVNLNGENTFTVTSTLEGLSEGSFNIDNFSYELDRPDVAEITGFVGNKVTVKGIANGSCKLIVSHEKAAYTREVLLIVTGQLKDAIDAACFITTSQNYIRTKVGADEQKIIVSLKGGTDGDEADFSWCIKSNASDGSTNEVISLDTVNGQVLASPTRAVSQSYSYGSAYLNPLCEGTAIITVTHPKVVYPTEILVKVLPEDAVLEEPLYFTGAGLIKILNGNSYEYEVNLKGENKTASDNANIRWECDNSSINIDANENVCQINAPAYGNGNVKALLNISHKKAETDKKVLILTADNEEDLNSFKVLYSDKLDYNLAVGESTTLYTYAAGYDESIPPDFSSIVWSVKDSSVLSLTRSEYNPLSCTVKGLKSGVTKVTVSFEGLTCEYSVTVYPEGLVAVSPEVYFTTAQNVLFADKTGKTVKASVTAVNLEPEKYSDISWNVEDQSVASVIGNGTSAVITSLKEGETVVTVSHPDSQNTLKLYVRIGSEYVIPETAPEVYISSEDVITLLKDDSPYILHAVLVNFNEQDVSGFSFDSDNSAVAAISAQTTSGTAYIKPAGSGQAQITIRHKNSSIEKKVLVVVGNSREELASYRYLTTSSNVVSIGEGNTRSISVSIKSSESTIIDGYTWESSNLNVVDITSTGSTALLRANSIGTAFVTVRNKECKYPLSIIVQVIDPIAASSNPYIQLSSSVLTLNVDSGYTSVTADLIGGNSDDYSSFVWTVNDSSICAVYGQNEVGKIRALENGQTYVTVTHPKANYSAQLLVVCDKQTESECYISVPASILNIKPNAYAQTITASLVNGSSTDKYNFNWSLDVYDVIDFQYSANICTVTPKQTGTATITISHPKSAYDQKVIVNVQEYSSFAFPQNSVSLTQGTVSFQSMQVPVTSVSTRVEYSVDNPEICSVTGTKAVAQITGINPGTTTVRANLVASSTGVVQASSEMLIYVKEAATSAVYISSGSTILTVNKGKSQTLSATLSGSGITSSDPYNLTWTTTDSDIISITGISSDGSVKGQSIYITALKPGEALITCSHEKAASDLQFYVVVPGTAEKLVSLNKSYMTLVKGSSGISIKASIDNAESSADYYDLEWNAERVNGVEIVRIMGSGQTVTIYPLAVGETKVLCQLPNSERVAECTVFVEAGKSFSFETSSRKVQPFHSKRVKYLVSPPDANLSWTTSMDDDYFMFNDLGCDSEGVGYVEISGLKEGSGTLACVTDGSVKASITVKVLWEYMFEVSQTNLSGSPASAYSFDYSVTPEDAVITIDSSSVATLNIKQGMGDVNGDGVKVLTGKGTVQVTPKKEGTESVTIRATNKDNGEVIGSKTIKMSFVYPSVNIRASLVSKNGSFSYYDSDNEILYIGDGEQITLNFTVAEKVDWRITSSSLDKRVSSSYNTKLTNGINSQVVIKNTNDVVTQEYLIPVWYVPMLVKEVKNVIHTQGGTVEQITYEESNSQLDPKTDFSWKENLTGFLDGYADWYLEPEHFWKREDPSKANTRMSISEYQSTPWYWQPAHDAIHKWIGNGIAAGPWAAEQTGNQPAILVNTNSTKIVSTENTDLLTVTIEHSGVKQSCQINVITDTRNCVYNQ